MDNFTPIKTFEKKKKKMNKFILIANIFLMIFVVGLTGYYLSGRYLETQKSKAMDQCDISCTPGEVNEQGQTCANAGVGNIDCQHWTTCEDPAGTGDPNCDGKHGGNWDYPQCPSGQLSCGTANEDGNNDSEQKLGPVGKSFLCTTVKDCGNNYWPSKVNYSYAPCGGTTCHKNCMCCPEGKQRSCTLGDKYSYNQTINWGDEGWEKLQACKSRDDTFISYEEVVPGCHNWDDVESKPACTIKTTCIHKTCTCQGEVKPTKTPTPTKKPTPTPTRVPTPTPVVNGCNQTCNYTINPPINCGSASGVAMTCYKTNTLPGSSGLCRNPNCLTSTDCRCVTTVTPTLTPTPTRTPTPSRTPTPTVTPLISNTPTVTPLVSNTPSPSATPTTGPSATPVPVLCGTKGCDNATNPCRSGYSCLQANDGSNYCMMPEYATACKANPTYNNCCTAPGAPTATPTEIILAQVTTAPTTTQLLQTGVVKSFMYWIPAIIILFGLVL